LNFSDYLLAERGKVTLQNAGVRADGITLDFFVLGFLIGTLNKEDMAQYIFSLLAENAIDAQSVEVDLGNVVLLKIGLDHLLGFINAKASARIAGQDVNLKILIKVQ
jgi:hypothetical protein